MMYRDKDGDWALSWGDWMMYPWGIRADRVTSPRVYVLPKEFFTDVD